MAVRSLPVCGRLGGGLWWSPGGGVGTGVEGVGLGGVQVGGGVGLGGGVRVGGGVWLGGGVGLGGGVVSSQGGGVSSP